MCHYCGCRQIPLIRDYIAEHERAIDRATEAIQAIERGDVDAGQGHINAMRDELVAHWRGEENGVFAIMRQTDAYAEHIDPLIVEHRELDTLLAGLDAKDPGTPAVLAEQIDELRVHIGKEEDGLFPVTLVEFSGEDWNAAIDAWHAAHPGKQMIEEPTA